MICNLNKKEMNKQNSAYIKHKEEWKRQKEEEQTRETEGAKRENNRKEERNKEEAEEKNKKKEEALLYESPRRKPGWRFTAGCKIQIQGVQRRCMTNDISFWIYEFCASDLVRSTLLFLLLQKFWGTLKGVQEASCKFVVSWLQYWIWKSFCRRFSISFRYILAMTTNFHSTDLILKLTMEIWRSVAEMWTMKNCFFQVPKLVTFKTEIKQKHISRCVRRIRMI